MGKGHEFHPKRLREWNELEPDPKRATQSNSTKTSLMTAIIEHQEAANHLYLDPVSKLPLQCVGCPRSLRCA